MRAENIEIYWLPFHFQKRNLEKNKNIPVTRWLWNSKGVGTPFIYGLLWTFFQIILSPVTLFIIDLLFVLIFYHFIYNILILKGLVYIIKKIIVDPLSKGLSALLILTGIILVIWLLIQSFKLGLW